MRLRLAGVNSLCFVLGCRIGKFLPGFFWGRVFVSGTFCREMPGKLGGIISDFGGGGVSVSAPLFAPPPAIGTYPPGRGEGGGPLRKLTIPQTLARNGATTGANFSEVEGFADAVGEHALDTLALLPHGRTVVATSVLAECDGDIEGVLHEFSCVTAQLM